MLRHVAYVRQYTPVGMGISSGMDSAGIGWVVLYRPPEAWQLEALLLQLFQWGAGHRMAAQVVDCDRRQALEVAP